jgi:glycerol-3-phosphate dehydrogenase (NAD(P)+)
MGDRDKVAVIGGASMGAALAHAAAVAGSQATIWCAERDRARSLDERLSRSGPGDADGRVRVTTALDDAVRDAALVILAVPSAEYRHTARALAALDVAHAVLLSSTKAFEPQTRDLLSRVLQRETGATAVGVVAGANITPEILAGKLTAIVVAAESPGVGELAKRCLESEKLLVRPSLDRHSVEIVAALKNVVALGAGIAAGLELGFNARAIVLGCGLDEIILLGVALGADSRAFTGVVGVGDIFLTASSDDSLNRRLGIALGRGARLADVLRDLPEVPEGIASVRACVELAREHGLELPIAEAVASILDGRSEPASLEAACRRAAF